MSVRKRPLLVMFYSDAAHISPEDIESLERLFDDFLDGKKRNGFLELDLLIHTHGGEFHTSYRLIQLIRSYCKGLNFLVPTYALSGGTLMSFGADRIEMGKTATLSPIDVQFGGEKEGSNLLSIQKYTEFLENLCTKTYKFEDERNRSGFLTELTKSLVEEFKLEELGDLFRLRSLTDLYAKTLLHDYMLKNSSRKEMLAKDIVSYFTTESPHHKFLMDYELVRKSGLLVRRMNDKVYKLCKDLIDVLKEMENKGRICGFYDLSNEVKMPFFRIYDSEAKGVKREKNEKE